MLLRLLLISALAAGAGLAQRGGGGGGGRGGGGGVAPMGDFASRPDRLETMTQMLKLNKDQKKTVKGILDEAHKEAAPVREELSKGRTQIADAVEAGKGQDEINQAVNSYSALEGRMTQLEMKAFTQIFSGLDADQKANQQGIQALFMMMNGIFKGKNWNSPE